MTRQVPQEKSEIEEIIVNDGIDFDDIEDTIRSHFDIDLAEDDDDFDFDEEDYEE